MGVGLRIFIVNDDNSLERLSLKKYEKLMKRDPDISFPQYASKHVRYAEVAIEFKNRKRVKILRILFLILPFNPEGMIDITEMKKELRLDREAYPLFNDVGISNGITDLPKGIVDTRYLFDRKRLNYEYQWKPTQETETVIIKTIFG